MAAGLSQETQMSIAALSMFPGFRFSPTDCELISYYLKKKLEGSDKCVEVISEVEICKCEPSDLPAKSVIQSDNEWFFFSARGRKYPNGSQSKRATELGYWKATGKERNVKSGSTVIGTKRTLVFHRGRAPHGERTEWIMHEYCMVGQSQDSLVVCRLRKNNEFRLNDTSNRVSPSRRHLSIMRDSNSAAPESRIDQAVASEGNKAIESCSKKCSSIYDSHSMEQLDSASESGQKLSNEVTPGESSSHQKDSDDDEDLYADILNEDIIELDETSLSYASDDLLPVVANNSEAERISQYPVQETMSQMLPFQGTANRRIKLKRQKREIPSADALGTSIREISLEKIKIPNSEESPKYLLGIFSARTVNPRFMSVVFVMVTFLALFLSLLGGSRPVKRLTYAILFKYFSH